MIMCTTCKEAFSINDDSIEPIYDKDGHLIRWNHKDCDDNEEESSSRNN